jgi:D-arabinose 1-dehydrogenase-like Zn-dependent alcohol dehydrogenase
MITLWICAAAITKLATSLTLPTKMQAVRKIGLKGCAAPDFSCVSVEDISLPVPGFDEVLLKVSGSGLNPDEITILDVPAVHYTLGIDVAGVIVSVGSNTTGRLKVGDRVWANGIHGGMHMGEYATRPEAVCGKFLRDWIWWLQGLFPPWL